jgi:hypothetical protein
MLSKKAIDMIAYEFYLRTRDGDHLIGVLPERRKKQERITKESVMNWGEQVIGYIPDIDVDALYFIQVEVLEN